VIVLDKEEQELSESVERGEWRSVPNLKEEIMKAKEYARASFAKNQRMNLRISKKDLDALKIKAMEEGMPYQTLAASVLHKYLTGNLESR
jgi:predicted DNA binding CopG/RHH family protein